LSTSEFAGARSAKLTALVKQASENSAKITITLNGNEIYSATPKTDSVSIEIPSSDLRTTNNLQWSIAKDGKYDVEFGKFTVLSSVEYAKAKSYSFSLLQSEYAAASAGLLKCTLEFTENSGATETDLINVNINGIKSSYYFSDYKIEEDVCSYLKSGSNTIELSATEDITVDNMKLAIESK
jgi:hypothetical protein